MQDALPHGQRPPRERCFQLEGERLGCRNAETLFSSPHFCPEPVVVNGLFTTKWRFQNRLFPFHTSGCVVIQRLPGGGAALPAHLLDDDRQILPVRADERDEGAAVFLRKKQTLSVVVSNRVLVCLKPVLAMTFSQG